ncbi:MAG: hypothetical protein R2909_13080, partial [Gemmatimonadales bacterium]
RTDLATQLTTALLVVAATACQAPTGPSDPDPSPRPEPELRRNASVVLRRIDVEGACDGKDLFGDPRKGNFAYRVTVRENSVSGTGDRYTKQSKDYGDALGQIYLRGPGESIDLDDTTYDITALSSGESVTVTLAAIEWDLFTKDSDMNGGSASQKRSYSSDGTKYYELNLGSGSCKVELEYAIVWSTP